MHYKNLGKSGLKVSRICLGTMTYGTSQWRDWVLDESESRPFIERALELGINFFDTADAYSLGISEEILGRALKDFTRREEVVIASKVFFPMGDKPNQGGLSRVHIMQAIEDSLRRLGTDYIDLYQIHRCLVKFIISSLPSKPNMERFGNLSNSAFASIPPPEQISKILGCVFSRGKSWQMISITSSRSGTKYLP